MNYNDYAKWQKVLNYRVCQKYMPYRLRKIIRSRPTHCMIRQEHFAVSGQKIHSRKWRSNRWFLVSWRKNKAWHALHQQYCNLVVITENKRRQCTKCILLWTLWRHNKQDHSTLCRSILSMCHLLLMLQQPTHHHRDHKTVDWMLTWSYSTAYFNKKTRFLL